MFPSIANIQISSKIIIQDSSASCLKTVITKNTNADRTSITDIVMFQEEERKKRRKEGYLNDFRTIALRRVRQRYCSASERIQKKRKMRTSSGKLSHQQLNKPLYRIRSAQREGPGQDVWWVPTYVEFPGICKKCPFLSRRNLTFIFEKCSRIIE